MEKSWIIGIDGGGTKTTAYATNMVGKIIARATETASNYHVVGVEEFKRVIISLLKQVTDSAGVQIRELAVLSLGLAGVDRPGDAQIVRSALADLGIKCEIILNNDAAIALAAGVGKKHGVVVIAGTGSIAYGVNLCGDVFRAGGFGHLIGDEGSGYAIAIQAIKSALLAEEGRAQQTALMTYLLKAAGLVSRNDLITFVYSNISNKAAIAALAEAVVECATAGDAVANAIVARAGLELAELAKSVIERGFVDEEIVQVIVCGSILTKIAEVHRIFCEQMPAEVVVMALECDAAMGAVNIALENLK